MSGVPLLALAQGNLSKLEQARASELLRQLRGRVDDLDAWIGSPHYCSARGAVLHCIERIDEVLTELACVAQLQDEGAEA